MVPLPASLGNLWQLRGDLRYPKAQGSYLSDLLRAQALGFWILQGEVLERTESRTISRHEEQGQRTTQAGPC